MSSGWIAAAFVSAIAHVGFAAWVEKAEPKKRPLPPIEMQLAKVARPPAPPPEPPPPPPPPPPPQMVKPKLVKKLTPTPPPPPPETQRVGVSEDATAATSDVAVATGVTTEGTLGTGTSMKEDLPPPPPAPPAPPPPPPPPPRAKVFPSYEVTQLPKIKSAAQPQVPDAFRQAQTEAVVVVEVVIDARGKVTDARVLKHADYGLEDAAVAAAKATEFHPALMGTTPVSVRYQIPYRFKVRG